jgi:APA family basic amino acid/polyamine antiporter
VISEQLGASIFFMPSQIAHFRTLGLFGWLIGGCGAILVTFVFSFLCSQTSHVGGPHICAKAFFGKKVGFFATWVYWCTAWACNPIIVAVSINYLMTLTGDLTILQKLFIESALVISLTYINIRGIKTTSVTEIILTVLKVTPLIIVPVLAITNINTENFKEMTPVGMSFSETITKATIFSFWAFVGLEGGTSPASEVRNPKRTIPLAIVIGTGIVAILSLVTTMATYGIIHPAALEQEGAPFSKMLLILFDGHSFDKIVGIVTFLMCYGSLNAWVFFSGQIAKTAAEQKMFPKFFQRLNKHGSPGNALWLAAAGTIVLLILQETTMLADGISKFVEMSVIVYIVLYLLAIIAYIKFMMKSKSGTVWQITATALALLFCCFVLCNSDPENFMVLLLMLATGLPVYLYVRKQWQD